LVEQGPVREVLHHPAHPYTQGLMDALPKLEELDAPLTPIPGDIPSPLDRPNGCVFHTRCPQAIEGRCDVSRPKEFSVHADHNVSCFVAEDRGVRVA
jgi:peptide/nickel transport system ATP-binding protein